MLWEEPIIGASVVEKGLRPMVRLPISMVTFTLTVSGNELQISYIGYLPQVVKVQSGVTSYECNVERRHEKHWMKW